MDPRKEINILLLGATGVGKSTFINAFANYISYETLDEAAKGELQTLVGTTFAYYGNDFEQIKMKAKKDDNESEKFGESQTQESMPYNFAYDDYVVRIIDTPGIGDTRGTDYDQINFENILKIINRCVSLHAICILMKPDESRLTESFKYCFKGLFSQLHKSVIENIIFVFTSSKVVNYKPGNTLALLRTLLDDMKTNPPYVEIKFKQENIYFVENEAFNALVVYREKNMFPNQAIDYAASWNKSSNEYLRMIENIVKLKPHDVVDTVSLNNTRRLLMEILKPFTEIACVIDDNMTLIKQYEEKIKNYKGEINGLQKLMATPYFEYKTIKINSPKMVCTSEKCLTIYDVGGFSNYRYEQTCCDPCGSSHWWWFISHDVEFKRKNFFGSKYCSSCDCLESDHRRIFSEKSVVLDVKVQNGRRNEDLKDDILTVENSKRAIEDKIKQLKKNFDVYAEESKIILKAIAKFDYFLFSNALSSYSDAFKENLMKNINCNGDEKARDRLTKMLQKYEEEKNILHETKKGDSSFTVSTADINKIKDELCTLNHFGEHIRQIYSEQEESLKHIHFDEGISVKAKVKSFLSSFTKLVLEILP